MHIAPSPEEHNTKFNEMVTANVQNEKGWKMTPSIANDVASETTWLTETFERVVKGNLKVRSAQRTGEMFAELEAGKFFTRLMDHDEFRDGPAQNGNCHIPDYRTFHCHANASYPFRTLVEGVMSVFWPNFQKE